MPAAAFDTDRFRKVLRLATSVPHEDSAHSQREREAARKRAERMAADAELSWAEALSKLDTANKAQETAAASAQQDQADPFGDSFREEAERRREAAARPWPEHPWEQALREALEGHTVEGFAIEPEHLPPETLQAICDAIPWPATMRDAIEEEAVWNGIEAERRQTASAYGLSDGPFIRRGMLRDYLEGAAQTPEDMVARARWALGRGEREFIFDTTQADAMQRMADDLARMFDMLSAAREAQGNPAQARQEEQPKTTPTARVTSKEKRARLRAVLSEPGADMLSTREVARRAGVSVQGAANYRKAMAEGRV